MFTDMLSIDVRSTYNDFIAVLFDLWLWMINTINLKYLGKAEEKPCQQQKDQRNMFSGVSLSESPSDAI